MKLFTVLGCVTAIDGAVPYMSQPATTRDQAVANWYLVACENIGVNPEAFPAASADHEALIYLAHGLLNSTPVFSDDEALTVEEFTL